MKLALRLSLIRSNCIKHSFSTLFFILVFNIIFNSSAFAVSEREQKIVESGKLRVCIWPDYFSISYKNKKNGQLEGIDIDLSQELAQDLGVTVEYVATHFGVFMQDLQADKCDIAMFGVGITEQRAEQIDFSEPYLSSSMYGIAHKTNPLMASWVSIDQPGVIVCVQKGTYMEQAMRDYLQHAELMTVVQSSQREIEVRSGRADVFIADYPYGQRTLKVYDWAKLLTPLHATEQFQYAYAIKQGDPEWLDRVNVFVRAIKADGRLEHYANKNNLRPIALIDP